jgi:hypothetical protein
MKKSICKGTPDLLREFLAFVPLAPGPRLISGKDFARATVLACSALFRSPVNFDGINQLLMRNRGRSAHVPMCVVEPVCDTRILARPEG